MNVYLEFLGCRLNEAEQASWQRQFHNLGHTVVESAEDAHVMAVNTCAVTNEASRKSRKRLRDLHKGNPSAKLVATGCYATLAKDTIAEQLHVDMVVSNTDKASMAQQILDTWGDDMPLLAESAESQPAFAQTRTRAFVKVQDGCHNRCSFCIVSTARGSERSIPIADVVSNIRSLHSDGYQEVVLAGVHLGGYGSDTGENLRSLIEAILKDTNVPRVRIGSLEPWDFPDHFMELWENPRMCPHLHLPLQSGSNSVLRRMIRRCSIESYERLVSQARTQNLNFNLTSDLIVGFPGETESEFQETIDTVQRIGFGDMHLFSYSDRQGTPASRMAKKLSKVQIRDRIQRIKPIVTNARNLFLEAQKGLHEQVLWERDAKPLSPSELLTLGDSVQSLDSQSSCNPLRWRGYTSNYLRVHTITDDQTALFNQITPVLVNGIDLNGELSVKRV
jgi:threonylcarbamoyladenosine tRNA methylthiotransferase MtaB